MALYDEIQARLRAQAQGLNSMAPATGTQAALTDAARAGTGRAAGPGTPAASNVGEQVQAASGQAQESQVASRISAAADRLGQSQGAIRAAADAGATKLAAGDATFQAQQTGAANAKAVTRAAATDSLSATLAGQEQRGTQSATQQYRTKAADLASAGAAQTDDLFAQFKQGHQELEFRKDQAQLEQAASQLALQDRAYMDQINQIGTLRRLDDDNAWRTELQRLTLGDKLAQALKSAAFQADLNADKRTFAEQMSTMDYDTAMMILGVQISSANSGAIAKGMGELAQTGGKAYIESTKTPSAPDKSVDLNTDAAGLGSVSATA